jgi:hypothetical protein
MIYTTLRQVLYHEACESRTFDVFQGIITHGSEVPAKWNDFILGISEDDILYLTRHQETVLGPVLDIKIPIEVIFKVGTMEDVIWLLTNSVLDNGKASGLMKPQKKIQKLVRTWIALSKPHMIYPESFEENSDEWRGNFIVDAGEHITSYTPYYKARDTLLEAIKKTMAQVTPVKVMTTKFRKALNKAKKEGK